MKILICSDGTSSAQTAIDLVGLLAGPLTAETTLLGIAERSEDEQPLCEALQTQAQSLRQRGVSPDIIVRFGEPILQIVQQTSKSKYDLVVIGARWTGAVIGAQIGVVATQYFTGPKIRLAFVPLPLIGAAIVVYTLVTGHKL